MEQSNQFRIKEIKKKFDLAISYQGSSKVYLKTQNNEYWNFYFQAGHLIWATSSKHRVRRLYRTIQKNCPTVDCHEIKLREKEVSELWGYLVVYILYKRKQVTLEKLETIIQEIVEEVLFDLWQALPRVKVIEHFVEGMKSPMASVLKSALLKQPTVKLDASEVYNQSIKEWESWLKAGLNAYSPNLALVIKDADSLEEVTSSSTFLKLSILVDGNKTLRELAIVTKKDTLALLHSFLGHIEQHYLELIEVQDAYIFTNTTDSLVAKFSSSSGSENKNLSRVIPNEQPLIVCIDDSSIVCDQICRMVNNLGFSFIGIQESIQALGILLENKPDLIFLDLVMPIINGHELCSQIRRIPLFKDIPIIILTSNDRVVDRVRSKMAGATELISKPIDKAKIFSLIYKYCDSKPLVSKV